MVREEVHAYWCSDNALDDGLVAHFSLVANNPLILIEIVSFVIWNTNRLRYRANAVANTVYPVDVQGSVLKYVICVNYYVNEATVERQWVHSEGSQ
jgi:hypothetical protein